MKKVAIVISFYNNLENLKTCLSSLKKTNYPNYKIFLVNDSKGIDIGKAIKTPGHIGFSKAYNVGIREALKWKPNYVLLLNDDTEIIDKDWLGNMIGVGEKNKNVGILGCKIIYPDGSIQNMGGYMKDWQITKELDKTLKQSFEVDHVMGSFILIKKEVIDEIGLLDEIFNPYLLEDTDYCYDKKTQVMTKNGLKYFYELNYEDELMVLTDDFKIGWQKPTNLIKKFESKLLHFKNRRVDILCSKQQKLLVGYKNKYIKKGGDTTFREIDFVGAEMVEPDKANNCRKFIRTALGDWEGKKKSFIKIKGNIFPIMPFVKFMGWYLSEGSVCYTRFKERRDYSIVISQCKKENKEKIKKIVSELGFKPKEYQDRIIFYDKSLSAYLRKFGKSFDKYIPYEIKELSSKYLRLFLNEFIFGDGYYKKKGFALYTSSPKLKDNLIEILIKLNISFSFSLQGGGKMKIKNREYNCRKCWHIQAYPLNGMARLPKKKEVDYNDFVYDVTVPAHRIYIFRNGRGCWSGNCLRAKESGFKVMSVPGVKIIHKKGKSVDTIPNYKRMFVRFKNDIIFSKRHLKVKNRLFRILIYLPLVAIFRKKSDEDELKFKNFKLRKEFPINLVLFVVALFSVIWLKLK